MKETLSRAVWMGVLLAQGLLAAPATDPSLSSDLLLRCRFSGLTSLLADTNAARLKKIWSLPATARLKEQAFDQLARAPYLALSNRLAKGAPAQTALFRPLLDDLLPGESFLEWRGPSGAPAEFVLVVQIGAERARTWNQNLRQALENWKLGTISSTAPTGPEGWTLKPRDGKGAFAFARAGSWVVIGLGTESLSLHARMLQQLQAEGRPTPKPSGHWLVADANLERLKPWIPPLASYAHPPRAHLVLSNQADYVRTVMRLDFPQGHGWKSEPWTIPTGLIRDPLISFTAMRGLGSLFESWKTFRQLLDVTPSQWIVWANSTVPFMTQVAVPIKNAGQQLTRLTPRLQAMVATNRDLAVPASVGWDTNMQALVGRSLPGAVPQLSAVKTRDTEFLVARLFPPVILSNAPPPELFRQMEGRSDLVYYDWEVTEPRLRQWRPLYQLADIATGHAFAPTNAPTQRWLTAVGPLLGNSVTEVIADSPTQLTLVRKSHCGFTGFEIVSFVRWLDSAQWPKWSFSGSDSKSRQFKREKAKGR